MKLMKRSANPQIQDMANLLATEFSHILVIRNLIEFPNSLSPFDLDWNSTLEDRKREFRVFDENHGDPASERLGSMLKDGADWKRQFEWADRIGRAAEDLIDAGWYPFFVTLTFDEGACDPREMLKDGSCWRSFKQAIAYQVAAACGVRLKGRNRDLGIVERDYFRFVAVIEHGESTWHDHIHAFFFCRDVFPAWKLDPLSAGPLLRSQCGYIEAHWPHGFATAEYWRCLGDPWSRLGFMMPETMRGKPLLTPFQCGFYLSKYLGKEDRQWNHRVKATRNFGKLNNNRFVQNLTTPLLKVMLTLPTWKQLVKLKSVSDLSLGMMRRLAVQEQFFRRWESNSSLALLQETKRRSNSYTAMLNSCNLCHGPWRMPSLERYDWVRSSTGLAANPRCEAIWWRIIDMLATYDTKRKPQPATALSGLK